MKNRMFNRDKQADGLSMAGRVIKLVTVGLISISLVSTPALSQEGPREYAKRIHDRLAGVPPTDNILNLMEVSMITTHSQQKLKNWKYSPE